MQTDLNAHCDSALFVSSIHEYTHPHTLKLNTQPYHYFVSCLAMGNLENHIGPQCTFQLSWLPFSFSLSITFPHFRQASPRLVSCDAQKHVSPSSAANVHSIAG
eukprot:m.315613 g.315613  ORF g.315613 m.315613 type:complete len:104 (-) comp15973_c0_seq53:4824-5135(-)